MDIKDIGVSLAMRVEAKLLTSDRESWLKCLKSIPYNKYVPLQYKPSFIEYQTEYFSDVYDRYADISMVLYRGGKPVGIWPLCIYQKGEECFLGSLGGDIVEPYFTNLPKAKAQRAVIQKILDTLCDICGESEIRINSMIKTQITVIEGASQWQRKWMELGGRCIKTSWWAYADLTLSREELQSCTRRTNEYSIAKGESDYDIEIYDSDKGNLDAVFEKFHAMHRDISGRETRSQSTWDKQKESIKDNSDGTGWDFIVSIRDKGTRENAGFALFSATPQTGLYSVAVYDRERFSRPVGHIVQAAAMDYMRSKGIRWYEIGERTYPNDEGSNQKLINIGKYKEGFATHIFPKIVIELNLNEMIKE